MRASECMKKSQNSYIYIIVLYISNYKDNNIYKIDIKIYKSRDKKTKRRKKMIDLKKINNKYKSKHINAFNKNIFGIKL